MLKRVILIIGTTTIILSAGVGIFFGINVLDQKRLAGAKRLKLDYQRDHLSSTLLKGVILEPSRHNVEETMKILLKSGDYKSAEMLNVFIKDENFDYRIAESALFNLHPQTAKEYIDKLPKDSKTTEVNNLYDWMLYGNEVAKTSGQETNAGRFLQMVATGDFRAFQLDNYLYNSIAESGVTGTHSLADRLILSHLFSNHQLNRPAIYFLDSDLKCNTEAYIYKSKLYSKESEYTEALAVIESGLSCDAANPDLLRSAINYASFPKNDSKYQLYTGRVNQLKGN